MKSVPVQDLIIGDVFAKEIKLHGRQAYEVVDKPANKNYLIVIRRGEVEAVNFHMKEGAKVYWLRNTK